MPCLQSHSCTDAWSVDLFPLQNLDSLVALDETCGFSAFREEYLTYPPPGAMPDLSDLPGRKNPECLAVYESVYEGIQTYNPCFDIYNIAIGCPVLWDVLGCESTHAKNFIP